MVLVVPMWAVVSAKTKFNVIVLEHLHVDCWAILVLTGTLIMPWTHLYHVTRFLENYWIFYSSWEGGRIDILDYFVQRRFLFQLGLVVCVLTALCVSVMLFSRWRTRTSTSSTTATSTRKSRWRKSTPATTCGHCLRASSSTWRWSVTR